MEFLAPPLQATLQIRLHINNGLSVRSAVREYLMTHSDSFAQDLAIWLHGYEQQSQERVLAKSVLQQQLLQTLERGFSGEPIQELLRLLEKEMIDISREDLNAHIERLPSVMLVPMILFQLPSFMLILIGPIISQLFMTLGGFH
jgi:hypothetical protein